jgi:xanthine dehydrogenase YagS FAD-binding subunit
MRAFGYARPTDPDDAVALVASTPGAAFLAGGTNLVDLMKLGTVQPTMLVDVSALRLDVIETTPDGGLLIGGGVRNSELAAHDDVRRDHPLLAQALLAGASGQVRNMATVAGNLLQRTRCAYFQDVTKPCNKRRAGSGCPARDGDHRNLAVLGTSEACIATHPSDMAVALSALEAIVAVRTPAGVRRLALDELYRLPGDDPTRDTVLEPGWLVESVEVPAPRAGAVATYRKVRDRASFAFAVASLAALIVLSDDGAVQDVRLALGGVAPVPWRARRAEVDLVSRSLDPETIGAAIDHELAAAAPGPQNAFKIPLVHNLVVSTLLGMAAR